MQARSQAPEARYGRAAVFFHWLVAALLAIQVPLGWWMQSIAKQPPGPRAEAFNLHKSLGLLLLAIVAARLAWRASHPPPPLALPAWQARLALANHRLLYALLLVMALSGYLGSAFSGYPVRFFGTALPSWAAPHEGVKAAMSLAHLAASWALLAALVGHLAGAVMHALQAGGNLAGRMR